MKKNKLMAMMEEPKINIKKKKKTATKKPAMTKAMKSTGSVMANMKKDMKGC